MIQFGGNYVFYMS